MRPQRDIESVLDAWLAPGPTEMPDGLFHDALERVERTPQRGAGWTPRRFTAMLSPFKVPLAAVVVALVIALVALPLAQAPSEVAAPAPSVSPSPSALAAPDDLVGQWAGAPRRVQGLSFPTTLAQWKLSPPAFRTEYAETTLISAASSVGPGMLQLESRVDIGGCAAGDVGTYRYTLSDDGTRAEIVAIDDTCPGRAAFLAGSWTRTSCTLGVSCVGPLAAGRHGSALVDPRGGQRDAPVARPGGLTYDLPAGWANAWDWLSSTRLVPMTAYRRMQDGEGIWPDQVSVWAHPVALTQQEPDCLLREDPAGGTTVESLAAWLATHSGLVAGEPEAVEIDGHPGLVIDIDMDADASNVCPAAYGGFPAVPLFGSGAGIGDDGRLADWDSGGWESDYWDFAAGGVCADCLSDPQRIILLDLDGDPLVILVDTTEPEDFDDFIEDAMPIVESFEFPE